MLFKAAHTASQRAAGASGRVWAGCAERTGKPEGARDRAGRRDKRSARAGQRDGGDTDFEVQGRKIQTRGLSACSPLNRYAPSLPNSIPARGVMTATLKGLTHDRLKTLPTNRRNRSPNKGHPHRISNRCRRLGSDAAQSRKPRQRLNNILKPIRNANPNI
jgi:hypothetical protein